MHGCVKKEGDIAREGGVDAITDGVMNGGIGSLLSCGGCKDEHVEVEEEPPEGGGVIDGGAVGIGGDNCAYDRTL